MTRPSVACSMGIAQRFGRPLFFQCVICMGCTDSKRASAACEPAIPMALSMGFVFMAAIINSNVYF